jgi:hypothetical protein
MEIQVQVFLVGEARAGGDDGWKIYGHLIITLGNIIAVCRATIMKIKAYNSPRARDN